MACITVFNQKGGVGKTTTALNLAGLLHRQGSRVYVIDLDPQGHLTTACGLPPPKSADASAYGIFSRGASLNSLGVAVPAGWKIIPAHTDLSSAESRFGKGPAALNRLSQCLDREPLNQHVLIDSCPVLGTLSLSSLFACDAALIPISADFLAMKAALQMERTLNALEHVLKRRVERRYLLTRFDSRRKLAVEVEKNLRKRFRAEVLETRISESVSLAETPAACTDIFGYAPKSRSAAEYRNLFDELHSIDLLKSRRAPSIRHKPALPATAPSVLARRQLIRSESFQKQIGSGLSLLKTHSAKPQP